MSPAAPVDAPVKPAVEKTKAAARRRVSAEAERQKRREERNTEIEQALQAQLKKAVSALLDRKAEKLVVLSLAGLTEMADYFVIASATNDRQAQAMADAVEASMKSQGRRPISVEGYTSATWVLLDFGDVIFHVFNEETRRFYALERLWGDAADATARFSG